MHHRALNENESELEENKKKKTKAKKQELPHRSLKNTSGLPSTSRSLESSSLPVLRALMSSNVISSGLYSSRQAMVALMFCDGVVGRGKGREKRRER